MENRGLGSGSLGLWLLDITLILAVCLLLFFRGIGDTPFYDKQEAREALVIWEIHNSGNWILPLRNGEEIPAKPLLVAVKDPQALASARHPLVTVVKTATVEQTHWQSSVQKIVDFEIVRYKGFYGRIFSGMDTENTNFHTARAKTFRASNGIDAKA